MALKRAKFHRLRTLRAKGAPRAATCCGTAQQRGHARQYAEQSLFYMYAQFGTVI
jgi:hypothetical protein